MMFQVKPPFDNRNFLASHVWFAKNEPIWGSAWKGFDAISLGLNLPLFAETFFNKDYFFLHDIPPRKFIMKYHFPVGYCIFLGFVFVSEISTFFPQHPLFFLMCSFVHSDAFSQDFQFSIVFPGYFHGFSHDFPTLGGWNFHWVLCRLQLRPGCGVAAHAAPPAHGAHGAPGAVAGPSGAAGAENGRCEGDGRLRCRDQLGWRGHSGCRLT